MPSLPHCPHDTARIVGPGRVLLVDLPHLVEVGRVEAGLIGAGLKPAPTAGSNCDGDAAVNGAGEDEAAVVVRVLPDQVHAPWGARHELGVFAELLCVRPCRSLLRLSQGRLLTVAFGMVPHPGPGVGDHGLELGLLWLPTKIGPDPLARGHERGWVPRSSRRLDSIYAPARYAAGGFDDLPDGEACSVAQVVGAVLSWFGRLERQQMGAAEVLDVDVVAYGAAVARRVVGAEDLHRGAFSCGLEDERDQVRLRIVVLPEPAAGAGHVEVAEARRGQPTSLGDGADEPVYCEFGAPVRVRRQGRGRLPYRHLLGLPVDGCRGREHEPPGTRLAHRLEEVERPADVVAVVYLGPLYGLADEGERREVQYAVEAFGERLTGESCIHEVSMDQARSLGDGPSVSSGEVVEHDRLVARLDELGGDDATDVAGPAGYKDPHWTSIILRRISAVFSGRTSMMKAPAPVSLPARYFSLS